MFPRRELGISATEDPAAIYILVMIVLSRIRLR